MPIVSKEGVKKNGRFHFSASILDGYTEVPFEGREFPAVLNWDTFLRELYGDYMTLPPENERTWGHHPLVISFDRSYNELS